MVRWLANITPLNAPVLPVYVCDLPLTGVKSGAELAARMSAAGLHPIVQATLMRPPVERGLPRYANGRPVVIPDAAIREDGRKTDKLTGRLYWAIEAAIWRDLEGRSFIDIAKGLGHSDYLQFERGNSAYRPRPQRAERLIVDGRDLLHLLGAWPWAHAADGRLPRGWRQMSEFAAPLDSWQRVALAQLEAHISHRRSMRALDDDAMRWLGA